MILGEETKSWSKFSLMPSVASVIYGTVSSSDSELMLTIIPQLLFDSYYISLELLQKPLLVAEGISLVVF